MDGLDIDIVVFCADSNVELLVYPAGTFDVVKSVRGADVAAVIEVKASPSNTQVAAYQADLRRLSQLTQKYPDCQGHFVLFDKSLHLAGATSRAVPRFDWLQILIADPSGSVEAHWVDPTGNVRTLLGRVV